MIHPKILDELVQRLGLTPHDRSILSEFLGGCVPDEEATNRGNLALTSIEVDITELHAIYAEVEATIRQKDRIKQLKGVTAMSMSLKHTPERNLILKEVDVDFFAKNDILPSPVVSDEAAFAAPPPAFSLKSGMSEAKDQGSAGTCTSFGVISCLDYFHGKRDLSEGHITHESEKKHGDCTEGLALEHAMEVATSSGVVDETVWPYDVTQICWTNPPSLSGKPRYKFAKSRYVFWRPARAVLTVMERQLSEGIGVTVASDVSSYSLRRV